MCVFRCCLKQWLGREWNILRSSGEWRSLAASKLWSHGHWHPCHPCKYTSIIVVDVPSLSAWHWLVIFPQCISPPCAEPQPLPALRQRIPFRPCSQAPECRSMMLVSASLQWGEVGHSSRLSYEKDSPSMGHGMSWSVFVLVCRKLLQLMIETLFGNHNGWRGHRFVPWLMQGV